MVDGCRYREFPPVDKRDLAPLPRRKLIRRFLDESNMTPPTYDLRCTMRQLFHAVGIGPMWNVGVTHALLQSRMLEEPASILDAPLALLSVQRVIQDSRELVGKSEPWNDGEEGRPIAEETRIRASRIVWMTAVGVWRSRTDTRIPPPEISPLPNGTIDIDWKYRGKELLINVPVNPQEPAHYYGDDGRGGKVRKAEVSSTKIDRCLVTWLTDED